MTVEQYWNLLIKQWRLIFICFLFIGLGTFITSKLMTPMYESTAVVQVAIHSGSNQADYNNLLASDQLVQTESQLAISDSVLREVASHSKGLTIDTLSKQVSSTPELNTQLFQITVLDASPLRAASLANDIATTLIKQQLQVVQQNNSRAQEQMQHDLDSARQKIDSTTNKIAALQSKLRAEDQLFVLQTQLNGLQQQFSQWQTALAQLELTEAQSGDFLLLAQPAQPGLHPVQPNTFLNTSAGLLAGLFLGMVLAVLFEQLDTRVRTPEALTQLLGWPVIGTIWRTNTSDTSDTSHTAPLPAALLPSAESHALSMFPRSETDAGASTTEVEVREMWTGRINPQDYDPNGESYRILRTNIGFSSIDRPLRSLMITSAMPGDGKSTIAANLAIFMAKAGKNTLLVDADLRRPVQHQFFNLEADKKGLSNAVLAFNMSGVTNPSCSQQMVPLNAPGELSETLNTANVSLQPYVHAVGIPNLQVMPSGPLPPNPSELLDSKAMTRLLTAFASYGAEVVIFDTPPICGLSDASILASRVDGTLLVVDVTRTNKKKLKQVKTLLTQAGTHVLGCVANKQRLSRDDAIYSYYYRHDNQKSNQRHHPPSLPTGEQPTATLPAVSSPRKTAQAASARQASLNRHARNKDNSTKVTGSSTVPANISDAARSAFKEALFEGRKIGQGRNGR